MGPSWSSAPRSWIVASLAIATVVGCGGKEPRVTPENHLSELTFEKEGFDLDIDAYGARGIRHITTFAVYMDAEYAAKFGMRPVKQYGAALSAWPRK